MGEEMQAMNKRPKFLYILVFLWPLLSLIFIIWGAYSLTFVLDIPNWGNPPGLEIVYQMLYFGTLISAVTWLVFACLFILFSYLSLKAKSWAWTTGLIISTIFIIILGLMLVAFMITAIIFLDFFPVFGLITVVIAFLIDLGIVYSLTRPQIKIYFETHEKE